MRLPLGLLAPALCVDAVLCALLCCAVLCCAVLCCAVLCCAVLRRCVSPAKPVHDAAKSGNAKIIAALIARKAHLNVSNNHGETPLTLAKAKGHGEVVQLLQLHLPSTPASPKQQVTTQRPHNS
jgi:hypothetical protein